VVLDLLLPDGEADELLLEMTLVGSAPPTVLLSGVCRALVVAAQFGVCFVAKRIDPEHLIAAVAVAIESGIKPIGPRHA